MLDDGIIDLRSDLVTRPTPTMVEAMTRAAKSAPGFGLREDPMVRSLEELAARLLGTEDALFCPTCTLCNQLAISILCRPGDTLLSESSAHIIVSEAGAPAALSGALSRGLTRDRGQLSPEDVATALATPVGDSGSRISLLALENTHTRAGGTTTSAATTAAIGAVCRDRGVSIHLDGARLFNAAAALGVAPSELVRPVDTVAISLNKGLCAPVGAVLAAPRAVIAEATRVRQRFGGGWRPATLPAAAGLVALERMPGRLTEDHERAQRLAMRLADLPGVTIANAPVQTNIVVVAIDGTGLDAATFVRHLATNGIHVLAFGPSSVRLVTHHDITDSDVDTVVEVIERLTTAGRVH